MTQTKAELLQTRHQGDIRLGDANSSHYVGFKAPATVGSNLVWTLPATDGTAGYYLKTDGSGNLGWSLDNSGVSLSGSTNNTIATVTGANALAGEANFTFDGDTAAITRSANTAAGLSISNTNNSQNSAIAQLELSGGDNAHARVQFECNGIYNTIRSDGSGNLQFFKGSDERLRVDSSGKVGIGNISPDRKIEVTNDNDYAAKFGGAGGGDYAIEIGQASTNGSPGFNATGTAASMLFSLGGSHAMRLDSSGRLLIGQTSADTDLGGFFQIAGNSYAASSTLQARLTADAHGPAIDLLKSRNTTWGTHTIVQANDRLGSIFFRGDDGVNYAAAAAAIYGEVDGTPGADDMPGRLTFLTAADGNDALIERMRIDSSGRVLIGTQRTYSDQTYYDDITINNSDGSGASGGTGITLISDSASWGAFLFGDENDNDIGAIKYDHNSNSMQFTINASERLRIASSGQFGIGGANYGSSGQVLTSGGSGAAVSWTTVSGGVSSDAARNTVGGTNAGDSIASGGEDNTVFGYDAGTAITTGDQVTAIGSNAAPAYTGSSAVFVGFNAGAASTSANQSTVVGSYADYTNQTGGQNVMIGRSAGGSAGTNHSWNTVVGYAAGQKLTYDHNVCVGRNAGQWQTSGGWGVFVGAAAGPGGGYGGTGHFNIAVGNQALHAQGGAALSGANNVCVGTYANYHQTTANHNTSVGHKAGYVITTGWSNTLIGFESGKAITTGIGNIGLGYDSLTSNSPSGNITTGNYNICLGDNRITNLYCADTSISSSDSRDKADVTSFTHGLDWITQLRPVTYRWDRRSWYEDRTPDGSRKRDKIHLGFIAQEAIEVEKKFGYADKKDNFLVANQDEDVNNPSYGFKYERLVPILVNAIKELSAKVEALEAK